jgi:MoxR-like ATPase
MENTSFDTKDYIIEDALKYALDGAVSLEQPLLLTGEPGTGKTSLAAWAVQYLNKKFGNTFDEELLRFDTKTTSAARDLFYTYDALSHFQSANVLKDGRTTANFIELQALGLAIAMSNPNPEEYPKKFRANIKPGARKNTVVLIDEVDKAPRDFTNDILDEIDKKRFRIREQDNYPVVKGDDAKIVVILTSNSEKNLPDAFLRRCAFCHIEFPKRDDPRLRKIVELHLKGITTETEAAYKVLENYFFEVRDKAVRKKPATAELIGWLKLLNINDYFTEKTSNDQRKKLIEHNLSFLVKTQEDLEAVKKITINL